MVASTPLPHLVSTCKSGGHPQNTCSSLMQTTVLLLAASAVLASRLTSPGLPVPLVPRGGAPVTPVCRSSGPARAAASPDPVARSSNRAVVAAATAAATTVAKPVGRSLAEGVGGARSSGLLTHPPAVAAPNVTRLYEDANLLLKLHRYSEAVPLLRRLTQVTPENGKIWMKLANVYRRTAHVSRAESTLRRSIQACPDNALLRQALADVCRQRKRFREARRHYKAAMELEPGLVSVYDSWGRMEASLGRHTRAAALYEQGLEVQPTARLCHGLGVLLDTKGAHEQARAVLTRGLALPNEQTNPQLLHALAIVDVRAGNFAAARSALASVVRLQPRFTMAHLSLGQLEERLGHKQAARRHYEAGATTKNAKGGLGAVQLWQSWARMEIRLGRPSKAIGVYKRAVSLFPQDTQLVVGWAKVEAEHGQLSVARELYARAMRHQAASRYSYQCAAAHEQRAGDVEAARALFAAGAALPSTRGGSRDDLVPLLHAWAVFEWRQHEMKRARELFVHAEDAAEQLALSRDSSQRAPPCAWLFQWRAHFEDECGHVAVARHFYARAVNVAPHDSSAWKMWADMEARRGDAERSLVLSRQAHLVETQEMLADAAQPSKRGNPLAPADNM